MRKGEPPSSARIVEIRIFGEVPTSVIVPPISDAKLIGIRKREGERPLRRAVWIATGRKMPSVPTFLISADKKATTVASAPTCSVVVGVRLSRARIPVSRMRDRAMARLTINTDAMMTMTGWANPSNALSCLTTPVRTAASNAAMATTS